METSATVRAATKTAEEAAAAIASLRAEAEADTSKKTQQKILNCATSAAFLANQKAVLDEVYKNNEPVQANQRASTAVRALRNGAFELKRCRQDCIQVVQRERVK